MNYLTKDEAETSQTFRGLTLHYINPNLCREFDEKNNFIRFTDIDRNDHIHREYFLINRSTMVITFFYSENVLKTNGKE